MKTTIRVKSYRRKRHKRRTKHGYTWVKEHTVKSHKRTVYKLKNPLNQGRRLKKVLIDKSPKPRLSKKKTTGKKRTSSSLYIYLLDAQGNVINKIKKGDARKQKEWRFPLKYHYHTRILREGLYTEESMKHPAKMNPLWAQRIIQEYSKLNEVILDPMAGVGTTGIEASRLGRKAVMIDIERKWVNEMKKNIKLLEKNGQKIGEVMVMRGDATKLNKTMFPRKFKPDVVIFSPPYGHEGVSGDTSLRGGEKYDEYGERDRNIGMKKGKAYDEAMLKVYASINKVLPKNKLMIVNIKDRTENRKRIRTGERLKNIAPLLGFKFVESRRIYAPPSGFRNIAEKKHGIPKIRSERILVFKKVGEPKIKLSDNA